MSYPKGTIYAMPTTFNSCFPCSEKLKFIGTSKPCAYCFMKLSCQTEGCPNLLENDSRFCKTCNIIKNLREENKMLLERVLTQNKTYDNPLMAFGPSKPITTGDNENDKIFNSLKKSLGFPDPKLVIDS